MKGLTVPPKEAAEDIFFGQEVIVWARWFVIVSGCLIFLWAPTDLGQMISAILLLSLLIAMNFFVHARYLMEKPVNQQLLMVISVVDLLIVSLIVMLWDKTGIKSPYLVLYYPLLLSSAFVYQPKYSLLTAFLAMMGFTIACAVANRKMWLLPAEVERLVLYLITMGAVSGLGIFYWRIQRSRRRSLDEPPASAAT